MIKQPDPLKRNITHSFSDFEKRHIDKLNEVFSDVPLTSSEEKTLIWLAGWEDETVNNIISAIEKAIQCAGKSDSTKSSLF